MKLFVRLFAAILMTTLSVSAFSQDELVIKGALKDAETLKKLENCQVTVFKNGTQFDLFETGGSGKYEFRLPLGYNYDIKFAKDGYVAKIVRIDTRNIPEEDRAGGFQLDMPGILFQYVEGFNLDIMKEPVGKVAFSSQENAMDFDIGYAERMKDKIDAEFKRLENLEKDRDKLKAEYDKYIREGDQKMIEKKYQDAMDKYTKALGVFPKDEAATKKYEEAKAAYDADQASAALEAKYQKHLSDGESAIKAKNWAEAKKQYTAAKDMKPNEQLPKQKLNEIYDLEKNAEKEEHYKEVMAAADKLFSAKDYALCIDKYKEASAIFPNKPEPKDQIAKAQSMLDAMLADAAKLQQIQQRYNDLMALGLKNKNEGNLESALANYREAGNVKPDEKDPPIKVKQIEDLIAQLERDKQKSQADALANQEKERIEREFNDLIQQADKLYTAKNWSDSKAKYQEALALKEAQYPRARIKSIEDILAEEASKSKDNEIAEANRLKEEERKRKEEELRNQREAQERLAEEARLKRLAEEEERRKRQEEELANKNKTNNFSNEANRAKEDEVEAYYREARQLEDSAKYAKQRALKEQNQSFTESRIQSSDDKRKAQEEAIAQQKEDQINMNGRGNAFITRSTEEMAEKKEQASENTQSYIERAENRLENSEAKVDAMKEAESGIVQNDRNRQKLINDQKNKTETYADNNKGYETRSGTMRTDAAMKVDKQKTKQQEMAFEGEKVRQENERIAEEKKQDASNKMKDSQTAADVRLESATNKVDRQKEQSEQMASADKNNTSDALAEINEKKMQAELFQIQKENKASEERYESRKEMFDVYTGANKTNTPTPGSENIPEGVTEKSYKLNNQIITERTVKQDGKVNTYLKSVSKTGIYYFKNGKPITKQMWIQETLEKN